MSDILAALPPELITYTQAWMITYAVMVPTAYVMQKRDPDWDEAAIWTLFTFVSTLFILDTIKTL